MKIAGGAGILEGLVEEGKMHFVSGSGLLVSKQLL